MGTREGSVINVHRYRRLQYLDLIVSILEKASSQSKVDPNYTVKLIVLRRQIVLIETKERPRSTKQLAEIDCSAVAAVDIFQQNKESIAVSVRIKYEYYMIVTT